MQYTITCYYNTGFGGLDLPSAPSVLANATSKDFPSVSLWQNMALARARVQSDFDGIKNADYAKIGDQYYTITGISMLSAATAELSLSLDPIMSAGGVANLDVIDGWVDRASPQNNTIFANNLPETGFQPRHELVIDEMYEYSDQLSPTPLDKVYVGCTIDLLDSAKIADEYTSELGNPAYVPRLPNPAPACEYEIDIPLDGSSHTRLSYKQPNVAIFDATQVDVLTALSRIRSLGLDQAIVACYKVPKSWDIGETWHVAEAGGSREYAENLLSIVRAVDPSIPYRYAGTGYTPKNQKVYSLYNDVIIVAMATGEAKRNSMHEVEQGGTGPKLNVWADPSPTGKPYIQWQKYLGKAQKIFMNAVAGANWQNTPLRFGEATGSLVTAGQASERLNLEQQRANEDYQFGAAQSMANNILSLAGHVATANVEGAVRDAVQSGTMGYTLNRDYLRGGEDRRYSWKELQTAQRIRVPDVAYPLEPSIQNYVGNGWLIYRIRLDVEDIKRLDRYLTMYGWSDSRPLTNADLTSHTHYNYVSAGQVQFTTKQPIPLWQREAVASVFAQGVRLWHELPNTAAYDDGNPIKGG